MATYRVEAGIMRRMVLWDTACNFNAFISNQSIFNCLITGASTLQLNDSGLYRSLLILTAIVLFLPKLKPVFEEKTNFYDSKRYSLQR